ncbi:hypothetical protein MYX82_03440 [Acidobacteria bacterium AH-259-D05]|nr:hypothetical protein [Acidobacteria bacterium AH-259-D05]
MPRKNFWEREIEELQKFFFRWEFIRRNPDYQTDYAKFSSQFAKWFSERGSDLKEITNWNCHQLLQFKEQIGTTPSDWEFFREKIVSRAEAFRMKWGVSWPVCPNFSIDPIPYLGRSDLMEFFHNTPVLTLPDDLRLDATIEDLTLEAERFLKRTFSDIRRESEQALSKEPKAQSKFSKPIAFEVLPWLSREDNLRRLYKLLDRAGIKTKKQLEAQSQERSQRKRPVRLDRYQEYLQVWDLKQSKPFATWPQLAEQLFSEEFLHYEKERKDPDQRNPVIQRVVDRYRVAEKLHPCGRGSVGRNCFYSREELWQFCGRNVVRGCFRQSKSSLMEISTVKAYPCNHKKKSRLLAAYRGAFLVAGEGFEPSTFGL